MQINTQPCIQPCKVTRKKHNSGSSQVPGFELEVAATGEKASKGGREKQKPKADPEHRIDIEA